MDEDSALEVEVVENHRTYLVGAISDGTCSGCPV